MDKIPNQDKQYLDSSKFFDLFTKLQDKVNDIYSDLNNGLKTRVENNSKGTKVNSKKIDKVQKTLEEIKKEIQSMDSYKKGKSDSKELFIKWGGWILGVLSFLLSLSLAFEVI